MSLSLLLKSILNKCKLAKNLQLKKWKKNFIDRKETTEHNEFDLSNVFLSKLFHSVVTYIQYNDRITKGDFVEKYLQIKYFSLGSEIDNNLVLCTTYLALNDGL